MPAPLVALAVVAAAAGVVGGLRARGSMRRHAQAHGWLYSEQDDALAAAWTLPPFAHPPAPGDLDTGPVRRNARMRQVARFVVEGSEAAALTFEHTHGDVVNRYQVAALRTGQGLPRTMLRAGIDAFVLPGYAGLHRVREPRVQVRNGVLAVLSEDPRAVETLPVRSVSGDLAVDRQLTVVADGDWLYAYRPTPGPPWRAEAMIDVLRRFARAVGEPRWPREDPGAPSTYVYGAV